MNRLPTLFLLSPLLAALLVSHAPVARADTGQSLHPGPFDRLELGGAAQVRYRQGDRDEVLVDGDGEARRLVDLELRDGKLTVRTQRNWWPWGRARVQLQITSRELRELSISGAADFVAVEPVRVDQLRVGISGAGLARFDQLQATQLRFSVSGAGDGQFAGQVEELRIGISGKGEVQAEQLAADRVQVSISGLGKAKVWAIKELAVSTSGIGTVEYWGSPELSRRSSGVSTINSLGAKAAPAAP